MKYDKLRYDPTDISSVTNFLESLDSISSILDNSTLIYSAVSESVNDANDITGCKKDDITKIIRHENMSIWQLSTESDKLNKLIRLAVEKGISIPENNQRYLINTINLINNKIKNQSDHKFIIRDNMINNYNYDLMDRFADLNKTRLIRYDDTFSDVMTSVDSMFESSFVNLTDIQYIGTAYIEGLIPDDFIESIHGGLLNKLNNTIVESFMNRYYENYFNLPIVHGAKLVCERLIDEYSDDIDKLDKSHRFQKVINSQINSTLVENNFNPNPYNIYNLCPFDSGVSTVSRLLYDIADAENDEEITEAIKSFATLYDICESEGEGIIDKMPDDVKKTMGFDKPDTSKDVDELLADAKGPHKMSALEESGSGKVGKAARTVSRKTKQFVTTTAKKAKAGADDIGTAARKMRDPMEQFIKQAIEKMRTADSEERRRLIVQGGYTNKIMRWVKRIIGAALVGAVIPEIGVLIAAISLIGNLIADKSLDDRERNKLMRELEDELKIVSEKIEDSRGDENKQKKYELMRIKSSLEKEIFRIKARRRS